MELNRSVQERLFVHVFSSVGGVLFTERMYGDNIRRSDEVTDTNTFLSLFLSCSVFTHPLFVIELSNIVTLLESMMSQLC